MLDELEPLMTTWGAYAFVVVLGLLWGSFANVCIYRWPPSEEFPRGRSVVAPGSHCFACKTPIKWYDNVPLLSWLWLRGQCRACKAPFSGRYLIVEALTGVLFGVAWFVTVETHVVRESLDLALVRFAVYAAFSFVMVVISFIDLDHKLILDKITLPSIVVFYGLGAYLVVASWDRLPPALSVPLAALAAAAFALAIGAPVLRVRGPYFVILSFGVAELVKFVVIAVEAAAGNASRLILRTPEIDAIFYAMLALAAAATALAWGARVTRLGQGLRAIREDEVAAETLGVPAARYKLAALALSAAIPGAVGGTMAMRATYFEPLQAFDPMVSFTMIATAVIGGSDDVRGPVLGALLLVLLSELLWAGAPQLYMVVLGVLVVVFVLYLPDGLCGRLPAARAPRA